MKTKPPALAAGVRDSLVQRFGPGASVPSHGPRSDKLLAFSVLLALLGFSACNRGQTTVADNQPSDAASSTAGDASKDDLELSANADDLPQVRSSVNHDKGQPNEADSNSLNADTAGKRSHPRTAESAEAGEAEAADNFYSGHWTTRRLIALAPGGPAVIDLALSLDGQNLNEAADAVTADLAAEIFAGLETPVAWEALLDQPLVKSGWLGNLIAEEDQVSQLIGMYDTERDGTVSQKELGAFLSRGLARNAPIQISDIGQAPGSNVSLSPWGVADLNQDYTLDAQEIEELPTAVAQFDYNGDAIITAQELNQGNPSPTDASMSRMSLLETNTLVFTEVAPPVEQAPSTLAQSTREQLGRESRRISSAVLGHYTFLEGVPRDEWSNWPSERWNELDANKDELLSRAELEQLMTIAADQQLFIRFPALKDNEGHFSVRPAKEQIARVKNTGDQRAGTSSNSPQLSASRQSKPQSSKPQSSMSQTSNSQSSNSQSSRAQSSRAMKSAPAAVWVATDDGGRVALDGCIVQVQVSDAFGGQGPRLLRDRLAAALKDPQLQAFFRSQLQLQEGAFELLDPDGDKILSDEEFAAVWRWLSARQGTRVLARWMTASTPWFQLLDRDGNRRLTAVELQQAPERLSSLDASADSSVTPNELPLMAILEVKRDDTRLGSGPFGMRDQSAPDSGDEDWFSAMDTNRDGFLANAEFLGDFDDFSNLDADKDGFISRSEVYEGLASY